jgi:hypothetical protein
MSDQSQIGSRRERSWPIGLQNVVQMEPWFDDQAELLDETWKMWGAWMNRRQEAIDAAFRMFDTATHCEDATSVIGVYSEWLAGNMKRIIADLDDARDEALRLAAIGQKAAAVFWRHGKLPGTPVVRPAPSEKSGKRTMPPPAEPVH